METRKYKYHYIKNYYSNPMPYEEFRLYQIGTAYCEQGATIPTHAHVDFFEISVVNAGKGTITSNNISLPVETNDIHIAFPFERHRLDSDKETPLKYDFFAFGIENSDLAKELYKLSVMYNNSEKRIIRNDTIKSLLSTAIAETNTLRPYQNTYLCSLFKQIVIQIIRSFNEQFTKSHRPTQNEAFCYQVMEYINTHIYSLKSLNELSDSFNYDYSYISNIFTKTTKQTVSDYYRFQRLEIARTLIHEGKLSLTEIAEKLNYSSIYSFSKSFKKQYGLPPSHYKKLQAELT